MDGKKKVLKEWLTGVWWILRTFIILIGLIMIIEDIGKALR